MTRRTSPDVSYEDLVPGREYRVLSVHPQWAWAIIFGGKDIENRSWSMSHRGRILIHASGRKASAELLAQHRDEICRKGGLSPADLPAVFERSAIIGSVEVVDCIARSRSVWAYPGEVHWVLREPRALRHPIANIHGKLQLWPFTATADHAAAVSSQPAHRGRDAGERSTARMVAVPSALVPPTQLRAQGPRSIGDVHTDEVMAAMRESATTNAADEHQFLRQVSRTLGFARMGTRVQARLKRELRIAIKRHIVVRDGRSVRAATTSLDDYDVATLTAVLRPLLRRASRADQVPLELAVVRHLGFGDAVRPANDTMAALLDATASPSVSRSRAAARGRRQA